MLLLTQSEAREETNLTACRLGLPCVLLQIHNVFHVGLLEPNVPNTFKDHHPDPPPLIVIDNQLEYKVNKILDSHRDRRVSGGVHYLVEWLGYENTSEANSWEPFASLEHAKELLFKFHHQHPQKLQVCGLVDLNVQQATMPTC